MSALPNSTGPAVETGVFLPSGAKAWEEIVRRFGVVRERRGDLRLALIELGLALMEIQKRGVPHGAWGQLLQTHGIPINTAKSSIRAAKGHLGLLPARKVGFDAYTTRPVGNSVTNCSGETERNLADEELDESAQFACEEEMEALEKAVTELERGAAGVAHGETLTVRVDKHGEFRETIPAVALAGKPPVAQENGAIDLGQVGSVMLGTAEKVEGLGAPRLRLTEVGAGRRPDVDGQMTLVGAFAAARTRLMQAVTLRGERAEKAAALCREFNERMDVILGEAA